LNWTKIGTNKQLDHKNKPVMAFLNFYKIDPRVNTTVSTSGLVRPLKKVYNLKSSLY